MKAKRAVIGRCPWSIIGRHVKLVSFALFNIRFFGKYNNNLLGLRIVPRETENNGYAKSFFWGGGGVERGREERLSWYFPKWRMVRGLKMFVRLFRVKQERESRKV